MRLVPLIDKPDGAELTDSDLALLQHRRRPVLVDPGDPDPDYVPEPPGQEWTERRPGSSPRRRVRVRPAERIPAPQDRPLIVVTENEHEVVEAVLAELPALPIYSRSLALVSVVRDSDTGAPSIRLVDGASLRVWTTRVAAFGKRKLIKEEWVAVPVHPPEWLTPALMAHGEWPGVPPLAGILETPTIRADGSVLQTPGYDPATRMVLLPGEEFPAVPDEPTQADAARALQELREPFCDVPFASEADAMAPIAMILTLIGRPAITGAVPMMGVESNVRGAGKGLVSNVVSMVAHGRVFEAITFRSDPEEQEKTLASYTRAGYSLIAFDNVDVPVGGAALDKCLTAQDTVSFRKLGTLETLTYPWRSALLVTGNNLTYRGDTARRVYRCRIESRDENPEDRVGFRHDPLIPWVQQNRARLVVAALTILRAHALAGRPRAGVRGWGSFEGWSFAIASAIVWAGGADPQATRRELEAQGDESKAALCQLLAWWTPDREFTAAQVAEIALADAELRATLDALCPGRGPVDARRVGYGFRHVKGRVVAERRLVSRAGHHSVLHWTVEEMSGG